MIAPLNTPWTEQNCELLRGWWENDGLTCGAIADILRQSGHNVTRNSVVGKVHRMGLKAPEWKDQKLREKRSQEGILRRANNKRKVEYIMGKKFNPDRTKIVVSLAAAKSSIAAPSGNNNVLLKNSKDGQCKFIVGYMHGRCEDAMYCGDPTGFIKKGERLIASPWCDYHANICTTESRPPRSNPIYQRRR
jgi:hypothetical protein